MLMLLLLVVSSSEILFNCRSNHSRSVPLLALSGRTISSREVDMLPRVSERFFSFPLPLRKVDTSERPIPSRERLGRKRHPVGVALLHSLRQNVVFWERLQEMFPNARGDLSYWRMDLVSILVTGANRVSLHELDIPDLSASDQAQEIL